MIEKKLEKLRVLKSDYINAMSICPPDEYALKQRNLLYAIVNHLLEPLAELEEKENKKGAAAIDKIFVIKKKK